LKFSKDLLFILSTSTLFGFAILGIGIVYFFQEPSVSDVIFGGKMWYLQLLYGISFGFISAFFAIGLIRTKLLEAVSTKYQEILDGLELNIQDIVYYSFCAAVGEELFFRAGVQPFIGIWITAIVFIALHGYLNPYDWRTSIYGIMMVLVTAGLGYLFRDMGLFSAICAHFIFDVVMFYYLVIVKE